MKTLKLVFICLLLSTVSLAQVPSPKDQIAAAVQTAPEDQQAGAKVWGFDDAGKLIELRKGTNSMVCLADDPNKKGYNAACYHKDMEEFMARGRALRAEGKGRKEIFDIREEEAKSGKLKMPEGGRALHIRFGKEGKYNSESGIVENTNIRYVIYIPWATAESSGLPLKPIVPGGPWIMDPGTHRAHIMVSPPKKD